MFDDRIAQLQLPDPADADPHPRLLLEGRGGLAHAALLICHRYNHIFHAPFL